MTEKTAIYRHYDRDGVLLYVGLSLNPIKRLGQHRVHSLWFYSITRVEIEWAKNREAAADEERRAVRAERPLFNTVYNRPSSERRAVTPKPISKACPAEPVEIKPQSRPVQGPPPREVFDFKVGLTSLADDGGMDALVAHGVPKNSIYDGDRVIDRLLKTMPQGAAIVIAPGVSFSDEHVSMAEDRGIRVDVLA